MNTVNFLNAVTNPFGANESAVVPDRFSGNSICLTDWLDLQAPLIGGALVTDMAHFCMMLLPLYSNLKAAYASAPNVGYQLVTFPLLTAGAVISLTAAGKLTSYTPQNYSIITGSATSYDEDECLVDGYRIFSMGLKAWPTIEVVTDSSITHILKWYGGLISPNTVFRSIVDGTNFLNIVKQAEGIQIYSGYEGCTTRYNPFANIQQLFMRSLSQNNSASGNDSSAWLMPIVVGALSASLQSTAQAPLMLENRFWLEGTLSLPTPIYSSPSPIDLSFEIIGQVMSRPQDDHPFVVSGHTFEEFTTASLSFLSQLPNAARALLAVDDVYNSMQVRNELKRNPKKRKNKKKAKKRKSQAPKQIVQSRRWLEQPKKSVPNSQPKYRKRGSAGRKYRY